MMVVPFHFSEILMLMLMNGTILNTQMQIVHIKYRRAQSHKHSKCVCVCLLSTCVCLHVYISFVFYQPIRRCLKCPPPFGCCVFVYSELEIYLCVAGISRKYIWVRILNYERFRILIPHYTKNWNGCRLDSCSNHTHTFHDGCLRKCIRN